MHVSAGPSGEVAVLGNGGLTGNPCSYALVKIFLQMMSISPTL